MFTPLIQVLKYAVFVAVGFALGIFSAGVEHNSEGADVRESVIPDESSAAEGLGLSRNGGIKQRPELFGANSVPLDRARLKSFVRDLPPMLGDYGMERSVIDLFGVDDESYDRIVDGVELIERDLLESQKRNAKIVRNENGEITLSVPRSMRTDLERVESSITDKVEDIVGRADYAEILVARIMGDDAFTNMIGNQTVRIEMDKSGDDRIVVKRVVRDPDGGLIGGGTSKYRLDSLKGAHYSQYLEN